jgi:UDP-2-acetamido-3-amino-2,3-dideoxy-glucuronate N-acetyltransferase
MKTSKPMRAHVHPSALVDPGAVIGDGTNVWQFSVVKEGARIGRDCNIGAHCYVEWGAKVGDHCTVKNEVSLWEGVELEEGVFVGPNAVFTNDLHPRSGRLAEVRGRKPSDVLKPTLVRYGATLGAGSMILAGVKIGRFATIGLGAVVTRDVPDHAVVVGNPASRVGWACACGKPLPASLKCGDCGRRYKKSGPSLAELK